MRMAISCRGSLPSGRRPTRLMPFSCWGEESGRSEKSIVRFVRRTLAPARAARADKADRFRIPASPDGIRNYQHTLVRGSAEPTKARFSRRVLHVRPVQCVSVEKHGDGFVERHAVFRRVDRRFPRIPLEHELVYTESERRRPVHRATWGTREGVPYDFRLKVEATEPGPGTKDFGRTKDPGRTKNEAPSTKD